MPLMMGLSIAIAQPTITPSPTPTQTPAPTKPRFSQTLTEIEAPETAGLDDLLYSATEGDRAVLVRALDSSLKYLQSDRAAKVYQSYPIKGVTRSRVEKSLRRFRQLVLASKTPEALQTAVRKEFSFYQSAGNDGMGTVGFTGYFEPVLTASRKATEDYRYPLYRQPTSFNTWKKPHPTRLELEGANGLQATKGKLKGAELVWLKSRLDAFLIQVQGSARLQLTDGTTMTVGFGGSTDYPYVGIGRELVKEGKFKLEELTLPKIKQYFVEKPEELDTYLPRNKRFVFFQNTNNQPPIGSLGQPVLARRSIATDKRLMPPGAIALLQTQLPDRSLTQQSVSRYVLDQDTGSAIIGPGRVDIFMGSGDQAAAEAGLVNATGNLYYLLLKP
ncbi:MAG: murein transglycosylase [Alkalinema sp. RU_4_3]|nr:murein transglycosylase [Alkalinema sp. RU_4_3]